jgi:hypothetical protein
MSAVTDFSYPTLKRKYQLKINISYLSLILCVYRPIVHENVGVRCGALDWDIASQTGRCPME